MGTTGTLTCEVPNANLHHFKGRFQFLSEEPGGVCFSAGLPYHAFLACYGCVQVDMCIWDASCHTYTLALGDTTSHARPRFSTPDASCSWLSHCIDCRRYISQLFWLRIKVIYVFMLMEVVCFCFHYLPHAAKLLLKQHRRS